MFTVFIPIQIFEKLSLNTFKKEYKSLLKNNFSDIEISDFKTEILSGICLKLKNYDPDLIIFANGYFGKNYFYDADFTKEKILSFGKYFYKDNGYFADLENIEKEILSIKKTLESNILLTNSKKDEILEKISDIFFLLSGIYFNIFTLLEKTRENIEELENIKGKSEFEAEASLLSETSKTKEVELQAHLEKLQNYISNFWEVVENIFFK